MKKILAIAICMFLFSCTRSNINASDDENSNTINETSINSEIVSGEDSEAPQDQSPVNDGENQMVCETRLRVKFI